MQNEHGIEMFSLPMIRTRIAEDLVPSDKHQAWFPPMGMMPGSEDVSAMETAAGQERRNNLGPILSSVDLFVQIASEIMQGAILLQEGRPVDTVGVNVPIGVLTMTNLAVTRTVIANLLDLGIIHISGITVEGSML